MNRFFLLICILLTLSACKSTNYVILGSSIAEGELGLSTPDSSWAGRLSQHLGKRIRLHNLAERGYNTYQILETGKDVADKPKVDEQRNITAALSFHPKILLISMTSNDANMGYTVAEYLQNIEAVRQTALRNGVKRVLITTTTPRNLPIEKRVLLRETQKALLEKYSTDVIDFYHILSDEDGLLKTIYDSGDKVHPNDFAHQLLFQAVLTVLNHEK